MSLFSDREFAVLTFAPDHVAGGVVRYLKGRWVLTRHGVEAVEPNDPASAWKQLLRKIGCRRGMRLLIGGALQNGIFLAIKSVAMPMRERRGSLELELPRQLPMLPEDYVVQFTDFPLAATGEAQVDAYVFAPAALERLAAMLTQCERRAEEFCYPLLGVKPDEGAVYLPGIEPDFAFVEGQWRPIAGLEAEIEAGKSYWKQEFGSKIKLPESGFNFDDYFPALLIARLAISSDYERCRLGIGVLPDRLRQMRCRMQLRITALLVVVLLVNLLWTGGRELIGNYSEYYKIKSELDDLKLKTSELQNRMRRGTKERKENLRVAGLVSGEHQLLTKFAEISKTLPTSVRVVSLRWSEDSIDIVMQSDSENLNFPAMFESLGYWKIAQLQQRQGWNNTVSTINLKLVPVVAETGKAETKRKK